MRLFVYLVLLTGALTVLSSAAKADTRVGFICCSYHADRTKEYNEKNYGIFLTNTFGRKNDKIFIAGHFKNSVHNQANFIGVGPRWELSDEIDVSIPIGLTTGYEKSVSLFALPTVTLYDRINLHVVPRVVVAVSINVLNFDF